MDVNHILQYLIPGIFLIIWVIGKIFKVTEKTNSNSTQAASTEEFFEESNAPDAQAYQKGGMPWNGGGVGEEQAIDLSSKSQYQGDSGARTKDLSVLKKSFIFSELSSTVDLQKTKEHSEIDAILRDPQRVRKAVLTYEILGPPLCLRKNGKMGRSWQR